MSAPRAASAAVSAERVRHLVRAGVAPSAVLQRRVPYGGRALASLEGPAALSPDDGGAGVSPRAESSAAPTRGAAAEGRLRRSPLVGVRVGHRPARNFPAPAIARAAPSTSRGPAAPRCSDSARARAGVRSNASWNASVGGDDAGRPAAAGARDHGGVERSVLPRSSVRAYRRRDPWRREVAGHDPRSCRSLLFEEAPGGDTPWRRT